MYTSELIIGILIIIAGLLVKPYPNLIAGYNNLTKKEKEKVEIKKLSTMLRNTLICLGILVIIIGIVTKSFNVKEHYSILISSTVIVITVLFIALKGNNYVRKE